MPRVFLNLAAFALSMVFLAAPALAQKTFSSPEHHFRIEYLSKQWTEEPGIAASGNASVPSDRADDIDFVTGFSPAMHRKGAETYVVVQFIRGDLDRVREEDVRAYFDGEGLGTTSDGGSSGPLSAASIPAPVFDRNKGVVVFDRSYGSGDDDRYCRTAAFLTRDGILEVQCYAKRQHFSKDLEKFVPLLNGVKVDSDARYVAGDKRVKRKGAAGSGGGQGYYIGGGVGGLGIVGILVRLLMPRGDR